MAKQKKLASLNAKKGAATNAASVELLEIDIVKELDFNEDGLTVEELESTELNNIIFEL